MSTRESGKKAKPWSRKLWERTFAGWCLRKWFALRWRIIGDVPGDELLWRAVHKQDQLYAPDSGLSGLKSSFFRDKSGLSVDIVAFSSVKRSLRGYAKKPRPPKGLGLSEFSAAAARLSGTDVVHKPERRSRTQIRNYAHAELPTYLGTQKQVDDLKEKTTFRVVPIREQLPRR